MAKKKSAAQSKKKTTARSKAPSKKKSTAKSARPKAAPKVKASAKKTAAKKAPGTKAVQKKTAKKAVVKKAVVKKSATTKTAAKKTATKKAAPKKTAPAKKSTAKKAPAKKATVKKAAIKKAPKKAKGKAATKPKKKATPKPKAKDERHTLTDARAAASGLAARAGLKIVRSHTVDEPEEKSKTRRLKKSPHSAPQLEKYREILLQKRAEVAGDVNAMESEAFGAGDTGGLPPRQEEQSSDEYEQALSLGLAESQRRLLSEVNEALMRINNGTYGICTLTGGPIGRDRLDATPWTMLSLEGAQEQDRQNFFQ